MAMFRKKTPTKAVQVDGPTFIPLGAAPPPPPVGMSWTWRDGAAGSGFQLTIQTKEGLFDVTAKDWRCGPGPEGEFWVVKDAIFRETYEQVVERAPGLHDGCRNPAHSSSGSAFSVMDDPVQRGHSPGTIPPGAAADMGPGPRSAGATSLGQAGNDAPDFYASPGSLPEPEAKCVTEGCPGVRDHHGPCLPEMESPCPV